MTRGGESRMIRTERVPRGAGRAKSGRESRYRKATSILFVGSVVLFGFAYGFQLARVPIEERRVGTGNWQTPDETLSWGFMMLTATLVGLAIARRQPMNRVGWMFSLGGFLGSVALAADQWGAYALVVAPGTVPGGVAGFFTSYSGLYASWCVLGVYVPLMFPDGRLDGRFRRVVAVVGTVAAVLWITEMFRPDVFRWGYYGKESVLGRVDNPIGIGGATPVLEVVNAAGLFGLFGAMFLAIGSLVPRVFRARGVERQQLKVVAYTVVVVAAVSLAGANIMNLESVRGTLVASAIDALLSVLIFAIPAALGVAILRYRLYDIDVIINRTLVYGVLTAALLASYLVIVIALGPLLDPVTQDSDLAVAASTLVVAALFRPLRARIQGFIDRRFYRAKYDAGRAVSAFATRLRDEVDIESVRGDLLSLVGTSLQPRHVGLWVRPGSRR